MDYKVAVAADPDMCLSPMSRANCKERFNLSYSGLLLVVAEGSSELRIHMREGRRGASQCSRSTNTSFPFVLPRLIGQGYAPVHESRPRRGLHGKRGIDEHNTHRRWYGVCVGLQHDKSRVLGSGRE
ncbi:hypothetical protein H257_18857 [Aphanomyces astaci]|uniref:Uncharacterized protein n=1 Tax=Aphanomyces astaci TaxID=112090 RepID=W4F9U3_APHAT|nr:hypothetical protein H257_18857 [Aphanomyces astaci]ETV64227.1 hypothetical protein H257_18857 [Aphanomyces astaci]|eukprot:XP_009846290.1 hypothetical protein H257_18857 [Aphanomyces astaci]